MPTWFFCYLEQWEKNTILKVIESSENRASIKIVIKAPIPFLRPFAKFASIIESYAQFQEKTYFFSYTIYTQKNPMRTLCFLCKTSYHLQRSIHLLKESTVRWYFSTFQQPQPSPNTKKTPTRLATPPSKVSTTSMAASAVASNTMR